ncbi:MAG TPA: phytanoyl-CoA dioxygenase family protein [Mycobacteriales bacterium]|nr:phytanoyl-CoA dioxygenase family protein [Mycobacteriales bacterium]
MDDAQLSFYRDNGYLLVKGLLDKDEAAAYRAECHDLARRLGGHDLDSTWGSAREVAGDTTTTLTHCHDVQFHSAAFGRLLLDDRFTGTAAALMDTPNVQLHHTKMFIKPPEQGSPFPMHQDYPFFPHAQHSVAAAIFHFDDAPEEKGCVRVVPGSHKRGALDHAAEGNWHLPPAEWPLSSAIPCEAEAGDVLFFSYFLVHGSGINTSSESRTTLLVQFRDPADRPTKDVHTHSLGQGSILRGVDPTGRS